MGTNVPPRREPLAQGPHVSQRRGFAQPAGEGGAAVWGPRGAPGSGATPRDALPGSHGAGAGRTGGDAGLRVAWDVGRRAGRSSVLRGFSLAG